MCDISWSIRAAREGGLFAKEGEEEEKDVLLQSLPKTSSSSTVCMSHISARGRKSGD